METKNEAAAALGRLNKGVPKNYSPEERERRRLQFAKVREEYQAKRRAEKARLARKAKP